MTRSVAVVKALQDHIPRGEKDKMNSGWEKNKSQGIDKFIWYCKKIRVKVKHMDQGTEEGRVFEMLVWEPKD